MIAEEPLEVRDEELLEVLHLEEIEGNLLPQFRKNVCVAKLTRNVTKDHVLEILVTLAK